MQSVHLVTVWNPRYKTNAIDAHLQVLLDWETRRRESPQSIDPEDVYVWWGKVRSPRRLQPLPHQQDILAIADTLGDSEHETHLYLTDYRSLYVACVSDISTDDPRSDDAAHVPAYYKADGLSCDFWFLLDDIRLLVQDDLEAVTTELAKLRNVRYHDSPVTIYGGMLDLPLIVTRSDGMRFFDDDEYDRLANGQLWARFDRSLAGAGAMEATLRDDHFGAPAWDALQPTARRFIVAAEESYRARRADPASDISDVLVNYAKAMEVEVNHLLRTVTRNAPQSARLVKLDSSTHEIGPSSSLTLVQAARAMHEEPALRAHIERCTANGRWLSYEFAAILGELGVDRNPAAHTQSIPRPTVQRWRNRLLGVGDHSVLVQFVSASRVRAG